MPYKIYAKELRFCLDYVENKDMLAFRDGYRKMPMAVQYLKAAAENLMDMSVDPLVKRDHRLAYPGRSDDDQQETPVMA